MGFENFFFTFQNCYVTNIKLEAILTMILILKKFFINKGYLKKARWDEQGKQNRMTLA